jgi:multiple sugar transport system permease protein
MVPLIVVNVLVILGPSVATIYYSFTEWSGLGPAEFVGLQNYTRLLGDPDFHSSMLRTFAFVLLSAVIGQTIFAFAIAYLMADRPRWRLGFTPLFAALFLLPLAVPEAVAALLWASTANGTSEGLLNRGLGLIGLGPVEWLQAHAFETVTVVNIWRGVPFIAITLLAGLQTIPPSLYEAATLDGASHGRKFKAWARHSMAVSRFWFSAYRDLTVDQIERNTRIAEGLRKATLNPQEATAWARDL